MGLLCFLKAGAFEGVESEVEGCMVFVIYERVFN